jgi:hypothetical protein
VLANAPRTSRSATAVIRDFENLNPLLEGEGEKKDHARTSP